MTISYWICIAITNARYTRYTFSLIPNIVLYSWNNVTYRWELYELGKWMGIRWLQLLAAKVKRKRCLNRKQPEILMCVVVVRRSHWKDVKIAIEFFSLLLSQSNSLLEASEVCRWSACLISTSNDNYKWMNEWMNDEDNVSIFSISRIQLHIFSF